MRTAVLVLEVLTLMSLPLLAGGATPTPDEMAEARRWVAAKFLGQAETGPADAHIAVLANHDPVQKNARGGRPMKIAGREYTRGLYCHANSKLVVHLPGPGAKLRAVVGVDSNEQTSGGRGSVVFAVQVGEREAFKTGVMREGMAGVPVDVDLAGAREFVLEVGDAGDGLACDQSDWADASVILADGRVLWLGDMPLGSRRGPYTLEPPFSFTYGGKPSAELLKAWNLKRETRKLDDARTEITLTWTDAATGLQVRCVAIEYADFPTVEWTLHFKNTGAAAGPQGRPADTPILEGIQSLDTRLERNAEGEFVLHHFTGTPCTQADYEPFVSPLGPKAALHFAPPAGRPSDSVLPYFNLQWPEEGAIVAVGWPGQWAATFARDEENGLRLTAGQELTHFILHAGEEVRTPLMVVQFYKGDWERAQNVWRAWMLAHNLPRPGGKLPPVEFAACSSHQFGEMINANEENQKFFVDRYLKEGLKLDYWWMDAGWYINATGWPNTGTWEVDTKRFPGGLRAITDHAHSKGVKTIVWFEPERVTPGTWLYDKHPEWLLGRDGDQKLLNLGNPEARQWLTDHVDKLLTEQGIDLYRQDFNMDPLAYWRAADATDRQGITEIRHVEGYLAYWDELRRRHPSMLIDSCASGGRRNDLETLRRAVPLLRSDYILEPVGQQGHTYGCAFWYPYFGTGVNSDDPYLFRSALCPHITGCWDMRRTDVSYDGVRKRIAEWRATADLLFGDYWPLTPYSLGDDVWIAWQFDRADLGRGMVQAFRRAGSIYETARMPLRGLDPNARYAVTDVDSGASVEATGHDLMEKGLAVTIPARPGAALVTYRKL
jgi:alpha-galactosidase